MKSFLNKMRFAFAKSLLISSTLLLSIIATTVIAEDVVIDVVVNDVVVNDAKAELKVKLGLLSSFQADFSQSIVDKTGKELQSSAGKLILSTPNKLRWETQVPDEAILIADGETVWSVDPFVEQVTVIQQSSITQNNPLMLLVSDDKEQWQNVLVKKLNNQFTITTSDENANIVSLLIEFDKGVLVKLQSADRQQQKSLLLFSNIVQNKAVDPSKFSFAVPENYVVDDQRSQ